MASFAESWRIQRRVLGALMIRELTTRFGRENIGFLWIMVEPLMFGGLVSIMWRVVKGPTEHGIGVFAFVVSGYLPLTLFRHVVSRSVSVFLANGTLMYHRQIRVLDFIFVRFIIEFIGGMMAYFFIGVLLYSLGLFPVPYSIGAMIGGWVVYCMFTLSLALIIAPLSEMSEVLEKVVPVTTYIMIPVSGTFNLVEWLPPTAREYMVYSPLVSGVEIMRYGLFGEAITPYYNLTIAFGVSMVLSLIGLALCRKIRRTLVVE